MKLLLMARMALSLIPRKELGARDIESLDNAEINIRHLLGLSAKRIAKNRRRPPCRTRGVRLSRHETMAQETDST